MIKEFEYMSTVFPFPRIYEFKDIDIKVMTNKYYLTKNISLLLINK